MDERAPRRHPPQPDRVRIRLRRVRPGGPGTEHCRDHAQSTRLQRRTRDVLARRLLGTSLCSASRVQVSIQRIRPTRWFGDSLRRSRAVDSRTYASDGGAMNLSPLQRLLIAFNNARAHWLAGWFIYRESRKS